MVSHVRAAQSAYVIEGTCTTTGMPLSAGRRTSSRHWTTMSGRRDLPPCTLDRYRARDHTASSSWRTFPIHAQLAMPKLQQRASCAFRRRFCPVCHVAVVRLGPRRDGRGLWLASVRALNRLAADNLDDEALVPEDRQRRVKRHVLERLFGIGPHRGRARHYPRIAPQRHHVASAGTHRHARRGMRPRCYTAHVR